MKLFLLASLLLIASPAMATDWYILDMSNQRCVTAAHFADETGQPSFSSPLQLRAFGRAHPETGYTGTVVHHLPGISAPGNLMVMVESGQRAVYFFSSRKACVHARAAARASNLIPNLNELR